MAPALCSCRELRGGPIPGCDLTVLAPEG